MQVQTKYFAAPLNKASMTRSPDDGSLIVKGAFTSDRKDMLGDIITREATTKAIPAYKQWGNIRYMHQPKPVGKVTKIGEEDGLSWNEVEFKVMNKDAALEVEQGLLSALSVGILIDLDKVDFIEGGGLLIKEYLLSEISLVDHPANYDASLATKGISMEEYRMNKQGVLIAGEDSEEKNLDAPEVAQVEEEAQEPIEAVEDEKDITAEAEEIVEEEKDLDEAEEVEVADEVEPVEEIEEEKDLEVDEVVSEEIIEEEKELDEEVEPVAEAEVEAEEEVAETVVEVEASIDEEEAVIEEEVEEAVAEEEKSIDEAAETDEDKIERLEKQISEQMMVAIPLASIIQ